jgi:catechol 2,3-dioxygenase-like lactoylglutathione lyase family enzyme
MKTSHSPFVAALIALSIPLLAPAQQTTSRPAITGISHLTLFADDIAKSKEFYASLLGWKPVPAKGTNSGIRFYVNHLQYVELITPAAPGGENRLDSVGFSTSDVEALRKYLVANGVPVTSAVSVEKNGDRSFFVRDPEGNKVSFVQEGHHPPKAPKSASDELSNHIMHAGYAVRDRAALDHFYKDILGFHLYWQGGNPDTQIDWVMMQVPDGNDWIEYILLRSATPSRWELGSANHLAPGVVSVADLQSRLEQRGWRPADNKNPQVLGSDGKMQLDLHDPDGTRVEFMEFKPVKEPCCSPVTGVDPSPTPGW